MIAADCDALPADNTRDADTGIEFRDDLRSRLANHCHALALYFVWCNRMPPQEHGNDTRDGGGANLAALRLGLAHRPDPKMRRYLSSGAVGGVRRDCGMPSLIGGARLELDSMSQC